jgi:hypothetical protein
MDPKMPDIKSEVNKVDDNKKKSSGLLGLLGGGGESAGGLGGLGSGAAGAGGLFGGGGGGLLGAGGLLATKAGMLALVLMGSAVAAGIGLAGYKMFGPGEADRTGGNLSLFAPKPQAPEANAIAPVAADGSSASLGMMSQAAAKDKEPELNASAPASDPSDKTAANAARDAAAADAARREAASKTGNALNSGSGSGSIGTMSARRLTGTKAMGGLSSATGGGASSASASTTRLGEGAANGSRTSGSSAFSRGGPGAKSSSASQRGVASSRRSARGDARRVMGDQAGGRAGSSAASGRTYDGSATNPGGAIGPDGGAIGMGGAGDGTGAAPKTLPANSSKNVNEVTPPAPKETHMVTPWEQACSRALMLTMLAAALAFAASKLPIGPYTKIAQMVIGGIIIAIGGYIALLAAKVMSGDYPQMSQGMVVAAAGIGVIATGVGVMIGASKTEDAKPAQVMPEGQAGPPAPATAGVNGLDNLMGNPMVLLGGGLAVMSGIALMMMPKPKPVQLKGGEDNPDVRYERRVSPVKYTV